MLSQISEYADVFRMGVSYCNILALLLSVSARSGSGSGWHGLLSTRTTTSAPANAIQARQLTREMLLNRADRTVMGNLFGREDCSYVLLAQGRTVFTNAT